MPYVYTGGTMQSKIYTASKRILMELHQEPPSQISAEYKHRSLPHPVGDHTPFSECYATSEHLDYPLQVYTLARTSHNNPMTTIRHKCSHGMASSTYHPHTIRLADMSTFLSC